jgi:extradiol dioxygenase
MASVKQLGYAVLEVSDPTAWEKFATEILGLAASGHDSQGSVCLKMDDHRHRLIIAEGRANDLSVIGWEVANQGELHALAAQLEAAGVKVSHGTAAEAEDRRVLELIKFADPSGIASEAHYGPLVDVDRPFRSPRTISGFVTADMGFGHITMTVKDLDASVRFYRDTLGMKLSDWIQPQPERAVESTMNLAFFHCNPRHHSLAFWQSDSGKRLHHVMLELASVDDVGSTYEMCQERGVPIEMTLGRHTNDRMLSFYVRSPAGFSIEYGWGARVIDDTKWEVQLHRTGSMWGHRFVGH